MAFIKFQPIFHAFFHCTKYIELIYKTIYKYFMKLVATLVVLQPLYFCSKLCKHIHFIIRFLVYIHCHFPKYSISPNIRVYKY